MLTNTDLEHLRARFKNDRTILKLFNKILLKPRKDVKVLIAYSDREHVEFQKRIDKIEEHLDLPQAIGSLLYNSSSDQ